MDPVDVIAIATPSAVVVVRWPEDGPALERLRAAGTPRLIVVAADAEAPDVSGCDEDWVRLPASDDDVGKRMRAILARASRHERAPEVKGDGRISFRGRWTGLSATEESLARVLVSYVGEVVGSDALSSCVEPPLSGNALRIQVMRLRQRLGEIGLELRTVRGRGYVLEPSVEAVG